MDNILIGHCHNEYTGVTAIICPKGAVGGVDVRGAAPGTRETDLLKSGNMVEKINAVVLCGGSAFGLEAADGVSKYLREQGWGFAAGMHKVPIVCAAVLYDLNSPELNYPDINMGYEAAKKAIVGNFESGQIGAGRGATVGKILGMSGADRGGLGVASISVGGAKITAIVAVNALGDVFDEKQGKIIRGAKDKDGNFIDTERLILNANLGQATAGTNTTIGVIVTDAELSKDKANRLATVAHNGLARSIRPVHTMLDGDTLFAMSCGNVKVDFNVLCVGAVEAVRQAVICAVKD